MGLLRDDHFTQRGTGRAAPGVYTLRLPALVFLSLALMGLSRLGHPAVKELRAEAEAIIAPALSAALIPLDRALRLVHHVQSSYEAIADMQRLRDDNQRLKQWEGRAKELERTVGELANLSRALEQQKIEYRTVRVIATSSGAFIHSALLEAGTEHGIQTGLPVINAGGVLGRIVEAGRRTSRILLLTDINSRIPVLIGAGQVRAILAGDNSKHPRLTLLPPGTIVAAGEEIVTSGLGGVFPRGMRIGVAGPGFDGPRARLDADLGQLEYASVLLYENPGLALSRELRNGPPETPARARNGADRAVQP